MKPVRIIFVGPDCGGKTALARTVGNLLSIVPEANRRIDNPLEMLSVVMTDAFKYSEQDLKTPFIRDQWRYPVDILYQRAMSEQISVLAPHTDLLATAYKKAGIVLVYVTASERTLAERYESRGDELWNWQQIKRVAAAYELFYEYDDKHDIIKIDTTKGHVLEHAENLMKILNKKGMSVF